ncbi:SusC/RagA family TonB-linked outer membrane protein [Gaetbulibacter sp. M235]|uniref:SusC/RagA family TonB-linked outer membrane protein n=1 Tax=Gaetbulibacter sp. M235 TaxID=3126510 RepID=UPI00374E3FF9
MKLKLSSKRVKMLFSLFLFFCVFVTTAQTFEIKGNVTDESGIPLPGVSVVVKNTTKGTSTDFDGKFILSNIQKGETLVLSFIGYTTNEITINNSDYLNISLAEETQALNEVVVTALGIKREERALGYAVQKVSGENLQKISVVNVATSLTGKVSGLLVKNSSDFGVAPSLTIRGEEPLLVIDGVPYNNKSLGDISSEDIESLSVLKGATASALYGFRGANGAILVTTKNGSTNEGLGISTSFATNTMFTAGFLAIPERQGIYGRGTGGTYNINSDSSWGPVMDGTIRTQWDPFLKDYRDYEYLPVGKNNFANFLEQGYITNNNINVGYKGDVLALRSSINWIENKGQYPNSSLDKYTYTFGGDVNLDKFKMSSNFSYANQHTPNLGSNSYTAYDAMYSLLIWSAADFNVLDYKDNYWLVPDQVQNFTYKGGSNNPYFDRYERTNETSRDIFNVDLSLSYQLTDWLKASVRAGYDSYTDKGELRIAVGSYQSSGNTGIPGNPYTWIGGGKTGAYGIGLSSGHSINADLLLTGDRTIIDKVKIDYLVGGSIYNKEDSNFLANTNNGLTVPGFFSLAASKDPASVKTSVIGQQVNSIFGRLAFSYDNFLFLEATGRNDWASSLQIKNKNNKVDYFYPSLAVSFVVSELLPESTKSWLDLLKFRNSWTVSKKPASPYTVNSSFSTSNAIWGPSFNAGYSPTALYDAENILPEKSTTIEYGLQAMLFKNRIGFDVSYYQKETVDFVKYAPVSQASGYNSTLINIGEGIERRGWEISLNATPFKTKDWQWTLGANWSTYARYWTKIDDVYTTKNPWNKVGERIDNFLIRDYQVDPEGNHIIGSNGREVFNGFDTRYGYTDPDYIWGINSNLKYKNFELFISLDGVKGGLTNTRTESYMWQAGGHPDSVTPERALDVATPGSKNWLSQGVQVVSGTVTYSDAFGTVLSDTRVYGPNTTYTTYQDYVKNVHNSSAWGGTGRPLDTYEKTFFKLREISLTYNIPSKFLQGWGAKEASISFVGQNVFLWAKDFKYSDPDGGSEDFADPAVRYLGGNIKLTF